ncbi:MAG: hypothetical protein QF926_00505 [Alphaproteobacteria bacterium]|jgi:hypothetical protein|nr:hypothetical protein [Alphaproteobacteria bacterium]MDP6515090.1 hypothetical protein [Alphaproteobacteria bacterium]
MPALAAAASVPAGRPRPSAMTSMSTAAISAALGAVPDPYYQIAMGKTHRNS